MLPFTPDYVLVVFCYKTKPLFWLNHRTRRTWSSVSISIPTVEGGHERSTFCKEMQHEDFFKYCYLLFIENSLVFDKLVGETFQRA